jgi:hypothetical protein
VVVHVMGLVLDVEARLDDVFSVHVTALVLDVEAQLDDLGCQLHALVFLQ